METVPQFGNMRLKGWKNISEFLNVLKADKINWFRIN
jgi:hypothetical protein